MNRWRMSIGENYWVWRLYHLLISDAVSLQRPTKFRTVYRYLGNNLGRVADVGCGPGVFLRYLCKRSTCVLAVDGDEAALQRVKRRHRGFRNLQCIVAQVDHLPFNDCELDAVLFLEVLEHLTDDAGGIRELHRVLVPRGKLILSVPVPPGETNEKDRWGHKREGYMLDELTGLLKSQGFEIQDHGFAQFRFSRAAERLVRQWRHCLRLPAPIFISWLCYLDYLLSSNKRKAGSCLPACVLVMARKV
jgi:SAM-dependent methyltransferase